MSIKSLLLALFLCPLFVVAQTPSKSTSKKSTNASGKKYKARAVPKVFKIEGKLEGYPNGIELLLIKNGDNTEMAKTKLVNGKFTLNGSVKEPVLCFLIIGSDKPAEIYVENAIISFKGKKADPPVFEVKGSVSHKDFDNFVNKFVPLLKQANALGKQANLAMPGEERERLTRSQDSAKIALQQAIDQFVKDKPNSMVAPFVLNVTYSYNEDLGMLEKRFLALGAKARKSDAGKQLNNFINENRIGAVGTAALDFSQADTTGAQVALSSFRGKYVLVDFWASWCGPCRAENPNVVENFKKFSEKNFTVLGVSLDEPGQKDRWMKAIKEDGLTWTHVSDLQHWNNAAARLYRIQGIPQNILVDPSGKIVAKNLRGPGLEAKLCELLGCESKETKGF